MKLSDITRTLQESEDWSKKRAANEKAAILAAIDSANTLEDFKALINWGNFSAKPLAGDDQSHNYSTSVKDFFKENPDSEELVIKKLTANLDSEDSIVNFVKLFYGSSVFSLVADANQKMFSKFFASSLTVDNGEVVFKQEKIKSHTLAREILKMLIEEDLDLLLTSLKTAVKGLPNASVKFIFDGSHRGNSWDGRGAISVSENGFVPKLHRAALIAFEIDEHLSSDDAKKIVMGSPQYRSFTRALRHAINKMLSVTEADVYTDEFSFFLNRHYFTDFIRALTDFVRLLDDAREVGRSIFAWYYHLPRHGAVHPEKSKFLEVFSEVLSRSTLAEMTKLECVFDNGEKLSELSHFD